MTASQTYSKCGVPPRTTTPSATTASWWTASACATTGSSTAPLTRTTVGSSTPHSVAVRSAEAEQRLGDLLVPAGGDDRQAQPPAVDGAGAGRPRAAHDTSDCGPVRAAGGSTSATASVASSSNAASPGRSWPIRSRLVLR